MQRYNIFNQIHKALRALLYDTALCLQQTDFAISHACDAVVENVLAVIELFDDHAHHEDTQLLPAVFSFEPSVADAFEQEHLADLQLGKALHATIAELYRTKNMVEKVRLGRQLTNAFIQFMIFNLNHMATEEDVLNGILWRYYTDEEIKQMERLIMQSTPPEKLPFIAKWMLRGISNTEAVAWLKDLEEQAPETFLKQVLAIAKAELPAPRFQQIASYFPERTAFA